MHFLFYISFLHFFAFWSFTTQNSFCWLLCSKSIVFFYSQLLSWANLHCKLVICKVNLKFLVIILIMIWYRSNYFWIVYPMQKICIKNVNAYICLMYICKILFSILYYQYTSVISKSNQRFWQGRLFMHSKIYIRYDYKV